MLGGSLLFSIMDVQQDIREGPVHLVGCHHCDAVVDEPDVPDGGAAICVGCGGTLFRRQRRTVEYTFALSSAAAILFLVANFYPFLSFEMQGQTRGRGRN